MLQLLHETGNQNRFNGLSRNTAVAAGLRTGCRPAHPVRRIDSGGGAAA
jgi:hypothetical protein